MARKKTKTQSSKISKIIEAGKGIKLDLACGAAKQPGWIGIDIQSLPGVDIVHDIETYPWPLPDDSCHIVKASHIVEHINPAAFGFVNFMNEIWRVMKPDGQLMISMPYGGSPGFWQDPTHVNGCNENTFRYFDPLDSSKLYDFYKPKPWKIQDIVWGPETFLEVLLVKRREDPSYGK